MPDPVTGILAGGSILGAGVQASAAKKSAGVQQEAAAQQVALEREIYDDTSEKFAPFLRAGTKAMRAYRSELGLGPAPKGYDGFTATPGYQFQMDQGTAAVNALAGARGGLNSGRTMQELTTFGQGLASQEYGNHLNRLAGMADMGVAAAGNQARAGNAYATGAGNALAGGANAAAAGAIGTGNAISGAINNGISAYMYQRNLNALAA